MKKILAIVLTFMLAVSVAACAQETPATSQQPENTDAASVETSTEAPAAVETTAPAETVTNPYPENTITVIIPTSAGGGYDLALRAIAAYLPKYLPKQVNVICENQSGGGQMIGVHALYSAVNDGYTIGGFNGVAALLNEYCRPADISFKMADFEWLGMWTKDVRAIGVSNDVTATTWDELVAMGTISCGTGGIGTGQHTDMIVLDALSDISFNFVHYDGSANVEPAMGRNEIQLESAQISTIASLETEGLGHAFCVFADERLPEYPDVPTALEVGMPQELYDQLMNSPFFGVQPVIAAPPGTDPEIVAILRDAIQQVFADPDFQKEATENLGIVLNGITGEELEANMEAAIASILENQDLINALAEALA